MIQRSIKIFRIRILWKKIPHTCTSWSKCMSCISFWPDFWLATYVMQVCPTFIPTQNSTQSFSGRIWKRRQDLKCLWWGIIHMERSNESFEEITFILQKLIKPPDRWLIKEWMIGDSVITILSCNHPRTWKSYTPHRYQGKGWIKCLLI
jgi:hypothetical protein